MTVHKLIQGDVIAGLRSLPEKSIHCVVTSPPYFNLRDYGVKGQIGLEKTPEQYVQKLVEVFREVKRVLRDDGSIWLNLGDSYAGSGVHAAHHKNPGISDAAHRGGDIKTPIPKGCKAKDLLGIPWMTAFALRADGWYLRNDLIWHKGNPMTENVKDRCARSHEYVFLLTKSQRYYYDLDAVREPHSAASERDYKARERRGKLGWGDGKICKNLKEEVGLKHYVKVGRSRAEFHSPKGRIRRTVWAINCQSTKDSHFATFPEKLVIPCILAGTSEKGCCPKCGSPWERVIDEKVQLDPVEPIVRKNTLLTPKDSALVLHCEAGFGQYRISLAGDKHHEVFSNQPVKGGSAAHYLKKGYHLFTWDVTYPQNKPDPKAQPKWKSTCKCGCETVIPCKVLDPFMGSGTVALVSRKHNRSSVGCELNPSYIGIYKRKLNADEQLNTGEIEFIFEKAGE